MKIRKRLLPALAALTLALGLTPSGAAVAADGPPDVARAVHADDTAPQRQLLVMLRLPAPHYRPDASYGGRYLDDSGHSARRRLAEELARRHGLRLVSDWPMPALGVDCYVMEYPADGQADRISEQLSRDPRVEWAQPVGVFTGMDGGQSLYPVQPSGRYWHVAELHRLTTGRNVAVAVVDSGIDANHPDLAGQLALTENFVDGSRYAAEAHGTAVAGIIAARGDKGIVGVAPGARLMGLRACWQPVDGSARCSSFTLAKALNYAIEHDARIINLSLSGPPDRLLDRLLDVALVRGIVVVGAIDPQSAGAAFPASHAGVIAVAQQGAAAPAGRPELALLAPGRDVPASLAGGGWRFVSGNSYAAAHVSGMLALLAELRPEARAAQLEHLLVQAGDANAATIDACATIASTAGACSCSCAPTAILRTSKRP